MKATITLILALLAAVLITGCQRFHGDGVDQHISRDNLATIVWRDVEIVESWFDPLPTVTDSLIKVRRHQADSVYNKIQRIEKLLK